MDAPRRFLVIPQSKASNRRKNRTQIRNLYDRMITAMGVEDLPIPTACVKFYSNGDEIPTGVREYEPSGLTLTSCQSTRQASFGDSVLLTRKSIGCVAAAITFGLVDRNQNEPMGESLVYTDIMKAQASDKEHFSPPTPKDFSDGTVYACTAAGRSDFALFGEGDSGRFDSTDTAQRATCWPYSPPRPRLSFCTRLTSRMKTSSQTWLSSRCAPSS